MTWLYKFCVDLRLHKRKMRAACWCQKTKTDVGIKTMELRKQHVSNTEHEVFFFPCQSQSQVKCKCVEGKKSLNPNKSELLKLCGWESFCSQFKLVRGSLWIHAVIKTEKMKTKKFWGALFLTAKTAILLWTCWIWHETQTPTVPRIYQKEKKNSFDHCILLL